MAKTTKKITTKKVVKKTPVSTKKEKPILTVEPQNKTRKVWPIILVLGLIIVALFINKFCIVATVNGQPIFRHSYYKELEKLDKKQTLTQKANEILVLQEAVNQKVSIDKEEIESQIASIESQLKEQNQSLEAALEAEGLTKAELEEQIKIQKLIEKMASAEVNITDEDIQDYITKNKDFLPANTNTQEIKDSIRKQLENNAQTEAFEKWFTELQKRSNVVIR